MTFILILLAIPGVLAVLLRLSLAVLAATRHTVERFVARQIADQRAQRGDISGVTEAARLRDAAARQQWRFIIQALVWATLLLFPLAFPAAVVIYPFYSLLWLLPSGFKRKTDS